MHATPLVVTRRNSGRHRTATTFLAIAVGIGAFGSPAVFAQTFATTRDEIRSRVTIGDRLIVTTAQHGTIKGTLEELSPSSLRLRAGRQSRVVGLEDVVRVERRNRDSILNGLLIGAAIGGTVFLKYYSENALCQDGCQFASGALGLVGMGAAAGAGVDALITRREIVFTRSDSQLTHSSTRPTTTHGEPGLRR